MTSNDSNAKQQQLEGYRVERATGYLTTQQGVRVDHTDDSLTAGERGPTLLEDFHAREKITHFDHERIPERVVHARGAGAYGYFEPYDDSLADYTAAKFFTTPGKQTPVFVRFSTVAGSRGSADTVRDVRGFATKFYTDQGNYDRDGYALYFVTEAYKHLKPVAAFGAGIELLRKAGIDEPLADGQDVVVAAGVVSTTTAAGDLSDQFFEEFAAALAKHRAWERETDSVPA